MALWREGAVSEVALSIAANGFYPQEALLVVLDESETRADRPVYTVVEGNRRLAAVMLLASESLRRKAKADLPTLTPQELERLTELPVAIYQTRLSLWPYLGFRHLNGTKAWDAFSKAKYVADVHERFGVPIPEIAERIGDQHSTVARFYLGYKLLRQAEAHTSFRREDRVRNRLFFSHLYTAADQSPYRTFLGITESRADLADPVPKSRLPQLEELMVWLFGSKSRNIPPLVRTQNPDLNRLREVLASPQALSTLRSGFPIDRAHDVAIGDQRRFRDSLTLAKEELQRALGLVVTGFRGEADLAMAIEDIVNVAALLHKQIDAQSQKGSRSTR